LNKGSKQYSKKSIRRRKNTGDITCRGIWTLLCAITTQGLKLKKKNHLN
jgi:hypothetical protein